MPVKKFSENLLKLWRRQNDCSWVGCNDNIDLSFKLNHEIRLTKLNLQHDYWNKKYIIFKISSKFEWESLKSSKSVMLLPTEKQIYSCRKASLHPFTQIDWKKIQGKFLTFNGKDITMFISLFVHISVSVLLLCRHCRFFSSIFSW